MRQVCTRITQSMWYNTRKFPPTLLLSAKNMDRKYFCTYAGRSTETGIFWEDGVYQWQLCCGPVSSLPKRQTKMLVEDLFSWLPLLWLLQHHFDTFFVLFILRSLFMLHTSYTLAIMILTSISTFSVSTVLVSASTFRKLILKSDDTAQKGCTYIHDSFLRTVNWIE